MKPVFIALIGVAVLGIGVSSFLVVRNLSGGKRGGAATREALVALTVNGVNTGDRDVLLDIMVGPKSDREAVECDDDGMHDAEARDQHRAERVDNTLDEAKRRRLVLDHIGDDHADVVAKKGTAIDTHCTAKVDVVSHKMQLVLHDGKDAQYTANLTAMEIAGRWYLATIPLAEPVGQGGVKAAAPPVATPSPSAPPTTTSATLAPTRGDPLDESKLPQPCIEYLKLMDTMANCQSESEAMRASFVKAAQALRDGMAPVMRADPHNKTIEDSCRQGLDIMRSAKYTCG